MDEGIHALAMRKLRLDAAVLEGITATGDARMAKKGESATDTVQVCPCGDPLTQHESNCQKCRLGGDHEISSPGFLRKYSLHARTPQVDSLASISEVLIKWFRRFLVVERTLIGTLLFGLQMGELLQNLIVNKPLVADMAEPPHENSMPLEPAAEAGQKSHSAKSATVDLT